MSLQSGQYTFTTITTTTRAHTDRLCNQLGKDIFLVMFRHGSNNGRKWRLVAQAVLPRNLTPQLVEIDILLGLGRIDLALIVLDEDIGDIRTGSHIPFILRGQLGLLRPGGGRHGHGHGGHGRRLVVPVRTKYEKNKPMSDTRKQ